VIMFNRKTVASVAAVGALVVAAPSMAQVTTSSPSPAQASPRQASPLQARPVHSAPLQVVPNIQLNCGYFQRNSNGSWTQQRPVTVNGKSMDVPGTIITEGTVVGGIDLTAALNRQCH
jgi:hypothetical protein